MSTFSNLNILPTGSVLTVVNAAALPSPAKAGDLRYAIAEDTIYQYSGSAWLTITGTTGITSLTGGVTASGTGSVVATVAAIGSSSAADIDALVVTVNAGTDANIASTLVKRDASGNFIAGLVDVKTGVQFDDAGANNATIAAPAAVSSSYTLALPIATGSSGQALVTDGLGQLGWVLPATSAQIVSAISAVTAKQSVDLASTANIASLSGETTIDGIVTFGNTVLLKDQTDPTENGIWTTAPGAWTRGGSMVDNTNAPLSAIVGVSGYAGGVANNVTLWYSQADGSGSVPFVQIPTTGSNTHLAASKALTTNASGQVAASSTTATELGYVAGVTSAIQTQLNGKQNTGDTIVTSATNGGTFTVANTTLHQILTPNAATVATFTLIFPAAPVDGQILKIANGTDTNTITALTIDGNTKTVVGALTGLANDAFGSYVYKTATTTWYRIG